MLKAAALLDLGSLKLEFFGFCSVKKYFITLLIAEPRGKGQVDHRKVPCQCVKWSSYFRSTEPIKRDVKSCNMDTTAASDSPARHFRFCNKQCSWAPGKRFTLYHYFYYRSVLKNVGSVLSTLPVQEECGHNLFCCSRPWVSVLLQLLTGRYGELHRKLSTVADTPGVARHSFCSGKGLLLEPGTLFHPKKNPCQEKPLQ